MKICSRIILLVTILSSLEFAPQSFAAPACPLDLEWQPTPDAGVAGYALYYGLADGPLTNRMDVGLQTTAMVNGLIAAASYSFYVVAYDSTLAEGSPSSLLFYTPAAISTLKLIQTSDGAMNLSFNVAPGNACVVEYTDSLSAPNWNLITNAIGDSNGLVTVSDPIMAPGGSRFYRSSVAQ